MAHAAAEILISGMVEHRLELLLPPGVVTREKKNEPSTLDLAIGTEGIAQRMVTCQVIKTPGSDHYPIETTIQLEEAVQKDLPPRQCFKRMDSAVVKAKAQQLQFQQLHTQLDLQGIDD
jgi:hypothetical protein